MMEKVQKSIHEIVRRNPYITTDELRYECYKFFKLNSSLPVEEARYIKEAVDKCLLYFRPKRWK